MDELITGWTRIAWAQCWQVTLLIAGVWLVLRFVGKNRPHLACALWLVVLLKCVTPPLVSSPSGIFCWLQRERPVADEETVLAAAKYAAPVEPEGDAVVVRASPVVAAPRLPLQNVPTSLHPADTQTPVQKPGWSWPTLLLAGALAWLAGTIIYAAVALARWHVCWRKLCRTRQIEDPRLAGLLADLCRRLSLRRKVRLLITESPLGPAVVGLVRPTIVLPGAIVREKSPAELAPLIAHELIHIRRGDLWIGLLQTLAVASWWFHPLVRLASRLVTREAERCCDEETIAHLRCEPAAYARSLLDVLALKQQLSPIPAFPGVRPVDVTSQRLERIMQLGQGCHKRTPWWCWLVMLAAAAAVLPGAALVGSAKEKPPKRDQVPWLSLGGGSSGLRAAVPQDRGEEQVRREYDVGEVLADLKRERGQSDVRAEQFVTDLIRAAAPGAERMVWERSGAISVNHSPAAHDRIAALLAALRAHGHAELAVEVQIISGPKAVLNADGVDWQMIGAGGTGSASDHRAGSAEPRGTVRSVVERSLPAMLALIGEERARALLEEAQSDSRTNVLQAPKVTLFNGQSARIEDSVQRPFVVGVEPAKGDKTAHKPRIAVVSEGMTIDLRPVARKDGSIELDFGLELAQIRDVETAEFPIGPGKEPTKVQVPEIHTWLLNTTVEMKAEQTLVLSVPKTGKGKKEQQPLCVLVKVRKIEQDSVQKRSDGPTLCPGGWEFKLRPRQGHRLRVEAGKQNSDQVLDQAYVTGLRIEAAAMSTKSTDRILLESAKANVRQPQPPRHERGRPPREPDTLLFEVELNDEVSGVYGETKFRADRLLLTVKDPFMTVRCVLDGKPISPSDPRKPSPLKIMLDGNVQLSHNGSRIEAARAVLRIDPAASDSKGGVQIQVDDLQSFAPAPTKTTGALIEKVYPVADLVIPVPTGPIKISPSGQMVKREPPAVTKPDFDSLIELIRTTIRPDSWDNIVGGRGEISVATNSYSLVIRQEESVHKQIADVLRQLRRLQDVQVVLTLQRLQLPAAELEKAAGDRESPLRPLAQDAKSRAWCLRPDSISTLTGLPGAKLQSGPKITTFNGQSVDLWLTDGEQQRDDLLTGLSLAPIVTSDFRSLRLQVFGDTTPLAEAAADKSRTSLDLATGSAPRPRQLPMELRELVLGQVLVVDESQYAWQENERGVPILDKLPETPRLFKNASARKPDSRHFYLITPSILVASEEEAGRVASPRKE